MRKRPITPGSQFGRWIVLEHLGSDKRGMRVYLCQCDCSRRLPVLGQNLRAGNSRQCLFCARKITVLTVPQHHELATFAATGKRVIIAKWARKFRVTRLTIKRAVEALT